jgi:hypothetical protein
MALVIDSGTVNDAFNGSADRDALMEKYRGELAKNWKSYFDRELYPENTITLNVEQVGNVYNWLVAVNLAGQQVLRFYIAPYPACCGIEQINHFKYSYIPEAMVMDLMDLLLKKYLRMSGSSRISCRRVVFNFIEHQSRNTLSTRYHTDKRIWMFGEVGIPVENTNEKLVDFPAMYKWATSQPHQQLLTVNHRTENIIHFVDCMFG